MHNNYDKIIDRLWLGNIYAAHDAKFFENNGISVVINCTKDIPFIELPGLKKHRVPVHDNLEEDEISSMKKNLSEILPIIDHHYKRGRSILIHCHAGIQRAATVTVVYLSVYHFNNIFKAYTHVKGKRPRIFTPGVNFKRAIAEYITDHNKQVNEKK